MDTYPAEGLGQASAQWRVWYHTAMRLFALIGAGIIGFTETAGEMIILWWRALLWTRRLPFNLDKLSRQLFMMGIGTVPVATIMAFFVGMVLAVHYIYVMRDYGFDLETTVGGVVALTLAEEMAPVITALLVAGRVGSSIAAELGMMKINQEIDALVCLGINPIRYLVMPRLVALTIAMVFLVIYADLIGFWGGAVIATTYGNMSGEIYWSSLYGTLTFVRFSRGLLKAGVFGMLIAVIASHCGLKASGGAAGVGRATTATMVISALSVLVADYLITRILL